MKYIDINFLILGLLGLIVLINLTQILQLNRKLNKVAPKIRLIHFIYQSIATTDIQITQVIQQLAELQQSHQELFLIIEKIRETQKNQVKQIENKPLPTNKNMSYVNAISEFQSGKSLDEIALKYQLSRDELEILAAVYGGSKI